MKNKIAAIKELANEIGGEASGYSGRGMMGAECWSISCDNADDVIEQAKEYDLPRPKVDSLGRGYVCYWPSVAYDFAKENASK